MGEMVAKSSLTTVALGGIDLENLPDVLEAGAINFSAVRAITRSENPEAVIREMQAVWRGFYPED